MQTPKICIGSCTLAECYGLILRCIHGITTALKKDSSKDLWLRYFSSPRLAYVITISREFIETVRIVHGIWSDGDSSEGEIRQFRSHAKPF